MINKTFKFTPLKNYTQYIYLILYRGLFVYTFVVTLFHLPPQILFTITVN